MSSLKQQLLCSYLPLTIVGILLIGITALVSISVVSSRITSREQSSLEDQIGIDRNDTLYSAATLFEAQLQRQPEAMLNVLAFSTETALRTDYPFAPMTQYYDWKASMAPPVTFSTRYNTFVSYTHSSYNVYNKSLADIQGNRLSPRAAALVQQTGAVDPIMKSLFDANQPTVLSLYVATAQDGVFREMPGATDSDTAGLTSYDPRPTAFYVLAAAQPHVIVSTPPYYDEYVKQTMITVARTMHSPTTGALLGVAGVDLATAEVYEAIKKIKYLGQGRALLFDAPSGLLVVDSSSQPSSAVNIPYYSDLVDDASSNSQDKLFSEGIWTQLLADRTVVLTLRTPLSDLVYDVQGLRLRVGTTSTSGITGQYLLVVLVPRSVVTGSMQPVLHSITVFLRQYWITSSLVLIAMAILVAVTVGGLASFLVRQLSALSAAFKQVMRNAGGKDLSAGVVELQAVEQKQEGGAAIGIDEVDRMHEQFDAMMAAERKKSEAAAAARQGNGGMHAGVQNNLFDPRYAAQEPRLPSYEESVAADEIKLQPVSSRQHQMVFHQGPAAAGAARVVLAPPAYSLDS
jgi:hypothetical protein